MNDEIKIALVRLGARQDAAWYPSREWGRKRAMCIYQERAAGRRLSPNGQPAAFPWGLREIIQDADQADQQRAMRIVAELSDLKLCQTYTFGKIKRSGIQLTDLADQTFRALCGLPGLDCGLAFIDHLLPIHSAQWRDQSGRNGDDPRHGELWVRETVADGIGFDHPEYSSRLGFQEQMAMSAIVRGWVDSRADNDGRVWYRVVEKPTCAKVLADLPEAEPAMRKIYDEREKVCEAAFASMKPEIPMERGPCPMPVAI